MDGKYEHFLKRSLYIFHELLVLRVCGGTQSPVLLGGTPVTIPSGTGGYKGSVLHHIMLSILFEHVVVAVLAYQMDYMGILFLSIKHFHRSERRTDIRLKQRLII